MGLVLSVIIAYAAINEAIECIRHIMSGMMPDTEPDFRDLVEYYTRLLQKTANPSSIREWTKECGQGYLSLSEDKNGKLISATVKYYDGQPDSTAILFSTKISSFGQESVDSVNSYANGECRTERYTPTRTKTITSSALESFSVGNRNKSPTSCENISVDNRNRSPTPCDISDQNRISENSFERDVRDVGETTESIEKLTWHYRPLNSTRNSQTLPEIHFQSYDDNETEVYNEDFLRSLDRIKYRPIQRSDPSGRRKSFKKRHSSSSTSSRESRASREEELKMFTSLEEAEFERMNREKNLVFGSAPNLVARSHSRSRSRENSKERKNESWSMEASLDSNPDDEYSSGLRPRLKELPKLDSFEEEREEKAANNEVKEEDEEIDFWASSGD